MGFTFTILSFEDIVNRLFKSGYDSDCYRILAQDYHTPQDALLQRKNYEKLSKTKRLDELILLAKQCSSKLPKFSDYSREEVIFSVISSLSMPNKWFNHIFGHVDDEKELYPTTRKFLKRKFENYDVRDTSAVRSRVGIRYADFTLVKKGWLGGFEVISVDVKVDAKAFDYFINQANDFQAFSNKVYLLCTPGLVLGAGKKWGKIIDAEKTIIEKLKKNGIGLSILDFTTGEAKIVEEAKSSDSLMDEQKNKALRELGLK